MSFVSTCEQCELRHSELERCTRITITRDIPNNTVNIRDPNRSPRSPQMQHLKRLQQILTQHRPRKSRAQATKILRHPGRKAHDFDRIDGPYRGQGSKHGFDPLLHEIGSFGDGAEVSQSQGFVGVFPHDLDVEPVQTGAELVFWEAEWSDVVDYIGEEIGHVHVDLDEVGGLGVGA